MSAVTHQRPLFGDRAAYRLAAALGIGSALVLVYLIAAVGVMAESGYRGDLAYAGVLASVVGGVLVSRLRSHDLAHTMFTAALAMVGVAVIALVGGVHERPATSVPELLGLHAMFVLGFAVAGMLFRRADQAGSARPV